MGQIDWSQFHFWDLFIANAIALWRIGRVSPRFIARALVPILKFISSKTGAWIINSYLNEKYPKRKRNSDI